MKIEHSDHVESSHAGHIAFVVFAFLIGGIIGYAVGADWQDAINTEDNAAVSDVVSSSKTTADTTATTAATTTSTDPTAGWKTYTNSTYGFSFKYPTDWTKVESTTESSKGVLSKDLVLKVTFTDPAPISTTTRQPINNIYTRVYKTSSGTSLNDWLVSTFHLPETELANYQVGKAISMAGRSGYYSSIGCCGNLDRNYVIMNNNYIYSLGTEFFDTSVSDATMPSTFEKVLATFELK
jgi:hypothetical protein